MSTKIFLIIAIIFLFAIPPAFANSLPSFKATNLGETNLYLNNQGFNYPSEITPMAYWQPGITMTYTYILPTSWTWKCLLNQNLLNSTDPKNPVVKFPANYCNLVARPQELDNIDSTGGFYFKTTDPQNSPIWNKNYDGIMGMVYINGGKRVVVVRHNENSNFGWLDNRPTRLTPPAPAIIRYYQNTVNKDVLVQGHNNPPIPDNCYFSYNLSVNTTCWQSFNQFISVAHADLSQAYGWNNEPLIDDGPIIWPTGGYLKADSSKKSGGFYQPNMYFDGNFLYVYYSNWNHGPDASQGGQKCISAARSSQTDQGLPGTWQNYYHGSFTSPALPSGFSKDNITNFLKSPAGDADCLFSSDETTDDATNYFNIAKVNNTNYYFGVEERNIWSSSKEQAVVRLSTDLVNWTFPQVISETNIAWGDLKYTYPTLFDKNGVSNVSIDPTEFYVVGNRPSENYQLRKMKLSLSIQKSLDINGDGKVNLLDLTRIINKRTSNRVSVPPGTPEDLNGDNYVDDIDLKIFLDNFSHL